MNIVWQVLQFILTVIETGLCFAFYNMLTGTEYPERWKRVVQVIAVLGIAYLWNENRQFGMVSNFEMFLLMIFIFVTMTITGNKSYKVIVGVASVYLSSDGLLNILYGTILQFYLGNGEYFKRVYQGQPTGWRVLIYFVTTLTMICVYKMIKEKRNHFDAFKMSGIFLVVGIMEWWAFTWAIGQALEQQRDRSLWTVSILLLLILGSVAFFIVYVSYLLERENAEKIELKNQMAEKNYRETKSLIENSMLNFHDWKNHILVIQNYVDNQEFYKVSAYLKKIGRSVEVLSQYVWCENEVINLIINTKLIEAQGKDIRISVEVENVASDIEDYDLCSILSNLIDNAIEACQKVQLGKRWIRIMICEKSSAVIIKIVNSISELPTIKNQEYISEKKGRHGYGLKSVKSAVQKNGGVMKITNDTEEFSVTITFL